MAQADLNLPTDLPDWILKKLDPNLKDLTKYFLEDTYEIIQYARKNNFYNDEGFLDIEALIRDNDTLKLSFQDFNRIYNTGTIEYIEEENKFLIKINKGKTKLRQIFTMACLYIYYSLFRNIVIENKRITLKLQSRGRSEELFELEEGIKDYALKILIRGII